MSEPIYTQVVNNKVLNQFYQNVERSRQLTREVERLTEELRRAQSELLYCDAERTTLIEHKVVKDAINEVIESIDWV